MSIKEDILKQNGTFNKDSKSVTAEEFQSTIFFDPKDLVQVKYEMLRSVAKNELTVSQAAKKYGLSRQSFYINKAAVDTGGIAALIPQKTGPKNAHKLTSDVKEFIDSYQISHPHAKSREISRALSDGANISVHERTVGRYLSKKSLCSR
jgi:transposase